MATTYFGNVERREHGWGIYEVHHWETALEGSRNQQVEGFTDYGQAEAYYHALDDSAALWDMTGMPELCEAKTRLAYFIGTMIGKASRTGQCVTAVEAENLEHARNLLAYEAKQLRLKLDPTSVSAISLEAYTELRAVQ